MLYCVDIMEVNSSHTMENSIIDILSPNMNPCVRPLCGGRIFSNSIVMVIPDSNEIIPIVSGIVI